MLRTRLFEVQVFSFVKDMVLGMLCTRSFEVHEVFCFVKDMTLGIISQVMTFLSAFFCVCVSTALLPVDPDGLDGAHRLRVADRRRHDPGQQVPRPAPARGRNRPPRHLAARKHREGVAEAGQRHVSRVLPEGESFFWGGGYFFSCLFAHRAKTCVTYDDVIPMVSTVSHARTHAPKRSSVIFVPRRTLCMAMVREKCALLAGTGGGGGQTRGVCFRRGSAKSLCLSRKIHKKGCLFLSIGAYHAPAFMLCCGIFQ